MYENYGVLFVDDEVNILNSLKRGLIDEEYSCYFTTSGREALKILEKEQIAVVVSDMRMPEMDGFQLLKHVKERWPKVVCVVLSGYTQLQQILATINQLDIFKFISKPWKLEEEFKQVIYQALDFYLLVEENEENKLKLEAQNKAYQNILKSTDETITTVKKKMTLIGCCGKALIDYNKGHYHNLDSHILNYQEHVFDNFTQGFTGDEKEFSLEKFEEELSQIVSSMLMVTKIEKKFANDLKIKTTFSLIEAVMRSLVFIFASELKERIVSLNYSISFKNCFVISLLAMAAEDTSEFTNNEEISILDKKIEFVNTYISKCLTLCKVNVRASKKNGSFVVAISIPMLNEKD